jgi:mono/diheme cytochrome c family protein
MNCAPTSAGIRPLLRLAAAMTGLLLLAGCHLDMWTQGKIHKPYQESDFFVDGQSSRPPVPGTVARGHLHLDDALYTGKVNGKLVKEFPFPITKEALLRGQERFDIFCSPCHGRLGDGKGMIAQRGLALRRAPANYHTDRLRRMPVGHFYDVITNGFGVMYSYASRIPDPKDRWDIVAYIRALQYSQNARPQDLTPEDIRNLNATANGAEQP